MIDLTRSYVPTESVRVECPMCHRKHVLDDVEFEDTFEEEFDCEGCGRQFKIRIKLSVEFEVSTARESLA